MFYKLLSATALTVILSVPAVHAKEELTWEGCGITKKAFMAELAKAYEKKTGIKVNLNGGGATKGIRKAASGAVHIGGACRVALENTAEESNAYQVPVAWDALAVITHKDNPVKNINFDQLQAVFLGQITNWKQLGGPDAAINVYVRQGKLSGVGRTMRELIFANFDQEFHAPGLHVMKSSGPLEKAITEDIHGIGVTGISSANRQPALGIMALNGKEPSYDNIKSGNYVLYRPLYLVIAKTQKDKRVKDFITYATSREGQDIIRQQGTVPYSEALVLVMKQLEQYQRASARGAYHTAANAK